MSGGSKKKTIQFRKSIILYFWLAAAAGVLWKHLRPKFIIPTNDGEEGVPTSACRITTAAAAPAAAVLLSRLKSRQSGGAQRGPGGHWPSAAAAFVGSRGLRNNGPIWAPNPQLMSSALRPWHEVQVQYALSPPQFLGKELDMHRTWVYRFSVDFCRSGSFLCYCISIVLRHHYSYHTIVSCFRYCALYFFMWSHISDI